MTMDDLGKKLDQLLSTNDYAVFKGYEGRDYLKDRAMDHARQEWDRLRKLIKSGEHLPTMKKAS